MTEPVQNYSDMTPALARRRMREFGLMRNIADGLKLINAYKAIHDIHPKYHATEADKPALREKAQQDIDAAQDVLVEACIAFVNEHRPGTYASIRS